MAEIHIPKAGTFNDEDTEPPHVTNDKGFCCKVFQSRPFSVKSN
ncbi:hypothetical protein [Staphylococcus haemolyticus]